MALLDSHFQKFNIALLSMHTQQIFFVLKADVQNGHKSFSMKVNKNATLSTVNIAINDNHRLCPYNLRMSFLNDLV